MLNYLHITNGDGAANIIKQCELVGDTLPWRDTMHYGPFPNMLNLDDVSKIRTGYFSDGSKEQREEIERDFTLRNEHLRASSQYQEIILWFEHDLLDQLQILQLLNWFGNHRSHIKQLSIICINQFQGIEPFRGIGQLSTNQMASLFEHRLDVTEQQIDLAHHGWEAFRSSNPQNLHDFIDTYDLTPLPFLKEALTRHILEYPHVRDGLTQTERQILTLVSNDICNPYEIFSQNMSFENALYIGDWATYRIIDELCNCPQPLLSCESGEAFCHPPEVNIPHKDFIKQQLKITPLGELILKGQVSAVETVLRDQWLGGVHLDSKNAMWMWDDIKQEMFLRQPES